MFGPHLTLDLYDCNEKKLLDVNLVRGILEELPDIIGVHKITAPNVILYSGSPDSFDKGGVSGFIMFAESHLSIHTFVAQKHTFVDIFSCKSFDIEKTTNYFIGKFGSERVEKNLIMRGRHFPREMEKAKQIVVNQRKKRHLNV